MRKILLTTMFALATTVAMAQLPYGTYQNPIEDEPFTGDWTGPVHRGMYCVSGHWHHGWLREWEGSIVIKPSCGSAAYQVPID